MRRSRKMFSRLTSFVNNTVEALAPEVTHLEQFCFHWKAVTQFFLDTSDERVSVENTSIPHHIEQMLALLLLEERENGTTTYGPSLEFMLQNKILETLQTLGRADHPPGIKRQVLVFFTNLLGKLKQQFLPHVNAHKPFNKLIRCCGEVSASPIEAEEVAFLLQVSSKLRMDSYLVNFFLEKPTNSESDSLSPTVFGVEREDEKPEYRLVDSLLALAKSEDSCVAIKACEGLLLLTSIPEDNAASVIVLYTTFCERMADQLAKLFRSLPAVIDPFEMNQLSATWGLDHSNENMSAFTGKRQLIAFFSWLDYINQLSVEAHPMVSKALAFGIRERFILTAIEPGLSEASEPCSITVTALLTRCLKLVTSPLLAQEFAAILLGTEEEAEEKNGVACLPKKEKSSHKIRDILIDRINHISDQLAVETLRLFQALLQLPYQPIIDVLVTRYFKTPSFIDLQKFRLNEERSELDTNSVLIVQASGATDGTLTSERAELTNLDNAKLSNECENGIGLMESEHNIVSVKETDDEINEDDKTINRNAVKLESEDCNIKSSILTRNDDKLDVPCPKNDSVSVIETVVAEKSNFLSHQPSIREQVSEISEAIEGGVVGSSIENTAPNMSSESAQGSIKQQQQQSKEEQGQKEEEQQQQNRNLSLDDSSLTGHEPDASLDLTEKESNIVGVFNDATYSKKRVEKVVDGFLSIFPETLRTSDVADVVGCDSYLLDAHKQCEERALQSLKYNWPSSSAETVTPSPGGDCFYEGDFLQSIMKRLSTVLDQPFHINLEVTAIISLLCQFRHPFLHEFLMDTAGVVMENYQTPHRILTKVCEEMKVRASKIPNCQALLLSTRKNLNSIASCDLHSAPEEAFFQAVILLEEFCKELAAIALVTATQNENLP